MSKPHCPVCGSAFTRTRSHLAYCSPECARAGTNATKRAKKQSSDVKADLSSKWQKWYRAHRARDPLHFLIRMARTRARNAGIEFTISAADLLIDGKLPEICPVLGTRMRYGGGDRKAHNDAASIDRKNNLRGYIPGNVAIISFRANALKRDATPEEIFKLATYVRAA